jgi:ArsR family transcriptional regulator
MTTAPPILRWMSALSDTTRARVLRLLEHHELTVAELCAVLQLPQSTVSRHLRVLADARWVRSRREGTRALYLMTLDDLDPARRRLWLLIREELADHRSTANDDQRLTRVLAERQSRSQAFFASSAGQWGKLRQELFGQQFDRWALPALLDDRMTVGDLGCGTAQFTELIAPFVRRVVAVDSAAAMITAARRRVGSLDNVELRRGELAALPIDDGALDAAVMVLVLHHIADPPAVLHEVARVLRPGGRSVIVDMQPHDRSEYRQSMGHQWQGFAEQQITRWLAEMGFARIRYQPLPPDPSAKGPALFAASATLNGGTH